jgi:hypothetical protein
VFEGCRILSEEKTMHLSFLLALLVNWPRQSLASSGAKSAGES